MNKEKEKTAGLVKTVISAQAGNPESFEKLYSDYYYFVWKIGYEYFRDHAKADDVAQEVFINVYKNLNKLENPGLFTGWIRRIAYNCCHKMFTREKSDMIGHTNVGEDERFVDSVKQDGPDVLTRIEEEDIKNIIFKAIGEMKEENRLIGYMRFGDGLSYKEIAAYTNLPLGTVAVRIKRIKERLQKDLRKKGIHNAGFLALGFGPMFSNIGQNQTKNLLKVPQKAMGASMQSLQLTNLIAPIMTLATVVAAPMAVTTYQENHSSQETKHTAAIQEIIYDQTLTNKPIPLDIKIGNGDVDRVLLDGQEELIISENGIHTIELYKEEQLLETKQFEVNNIDKEKPDVIETETSDAIQFALSDNQAIDYQNIQMITNGVESKDYQLDIEKNILTITKDVDKNVTIIIPDLAGNKLKLDVNFYEIDKKN